MGLFKNEALAAGSPFRDGPLRQLADVERLTTDYVHWYNHACLHGELDYVTPEEYEQAHYAAPPDPPPGPRDPTAGPGQPPTDPAGAGSTR